MLLLPCCVTDLRAAPQEYFGSLISSRRTMQEDAAQVDENQPTASPDRVTIELINQDRAKVEEAELDADEKATILQHYLDARQFLDQASTANAKAAEFLFEAQNAGKRRDEVRLKLEQLEEENTVPKPAGDLQSLEQQKLELESDTERFEAELKLSTEEPSRRVKRQQQILTEGTDTQTQLNKVQRQLATKAPESENPLSTRGRMIALGAESQKLEAELALLKAERGAYETSTGIFSLRQELATKQLALTNTNLAAVVEAISREREKETKSLLEQSSEAKDNAPELLKDLATRNLELAQALDVETRQLKRIRSLRSDGQAAVQKVESELLTMQTRVEAIGLNYALGEILRRNKTELVNRVTPFQRLESKDNLQDVQLKKFNWQDERAEIPQIQDAIESEIQTAIPPERTDAITYRSDLDRQAKELLNERRRILGKLEDTESDLFRDLFEVTLLEEQYSNNREEFTEFLSERILWVRSEPALGFGDLEKITKGTDWLTKGDHWNNVANSISAGANRNLPSVTLIAVALLGLVLLQPRCRSEIRQQGAIAIKRGCREFSPTLSVLFQTVVLALLWPAIGLAVGWLITTGWRIADYDMLPETANNLRDFARSIGHGLTITSLVAIPLEMLRCVCRKEGLAQNHFSWTEGFRVAVRNHTGWFMAIALPLLFVIVSIEASDNADSDAHSRLGRVVMLALLAVSIVYTLRIYTVFRPGGNSFNEEMTGFDATVSRIRSLGFVAAIIGFVLLFLFAVLGYYESVYKIGTSLLQSIQLLVWTVIAFGVAMRFFLVRRRKLRYEQLIQQRRAAIAAAEQQAESGMTLASEALDIDLQNESGMDITDVSRQARELTGVIFLIVVGLALLGIWQYLLPATKILDSWELWPITVGLAVESVTARDLLLSLVAFAITFFSVRNIPGMLELLLLQRLPLDAGARYAVASILRYILLVVGVIFALGFLKIPWSNYSWLVAAISVGLGFGLQEIVANFVSGLILLLERPVRVGDVVTIDDVTGIVSRIQMRATTVTNWDNQELVVPNKDLISGKLLNWTLSSVINRIAIKVGVAYGTDIGKVRELISKIVERHPDVLQDPAPIITFEEFGDSSLNFVIRCCTTSIKRRWHLMDEINSAVNEAFEREGIEIPFPQRVVHLVEEPAVPDDFEQ